jgi:hypothetical protein
MKRLLLFLLFVCGFSCSTFLEAKREIGGYDGEPYFVRTRNKALERIETVEAQLRVRDKLVEKLKHLNHNDPDHKLYTNMIDTLQLQLNDDLQAKFGRAVMKGFNKDLDENISGIGEGIGLGIAATAAKGFGKVLEDKIIEATKNAGGGAWDNALESISSFCGNIKNDLFYDGHKPFFLPELNRWKKFIMTSISNVIDAAKEGGSSHSRNRDMTYRESENGEPTGTEEPTQASEKSSWYLLASGYASQLDFIVKLVDDRKSHYGLESEEAFYASQIKQRLIEFRDALLRSDSITSFYTYFQSNVALLKAQGSNIENLFTQLMVKVSGSSGGDARGGRSEKSSSMFSDDDDNNYGHLNQF